jgi:hypothetical protein
VDVVLAVSLDGEDRTIANVHWIEADEMLKRFDRAYAARKAAGHTIQPGRGMWLSMYLPETDDPVNRIGGGIGLAYPAKVSVPLEVSDAKDNDEQPINAAHDDSDESDDEEPLTIAEAKRRLAKTFGVKETSIKITVEA